VHDVLHAAPATSATSARPARQNLYTLVHKGLRLCLSDTLTAVGRMDPHDEDEVVATLARVRGLLALCRCHLELEDGHLHPAMEARQPDSAMHTAADHVEHLAWLDRLDVRIGKVEASDAADRERVALDLYRELALFVADNLEHMHVEETRNMEVLWERYCDDELNAIHAAILAALSPAKLVAYVRWMAPAASPAERAALLSGIQRSAPRAAFAAIVGVVKPALSAREWAKLEHAIGPAPLVAR
jgi:hypothetical protein